MAGKKFTTRKLRTLGKKARRRQALKVDPKTFGLVTSLEQSNLSTIRSLEAKLAEAASK